LENFDFNPVSIRLILHDCQWVIFIFFFFFSFQNFFYRDIGGLCGLIVGFRLVAFFALLSKTYRKN
jgi:hypothetical protein